MTTKQGKFLVARYSMRAKYRGITSKKGWMDNPDNLAWDEQVGFFTRVRDKDLQQWNVILDLENKKVVACRNPAGRDSGVWGTSPEYDSIYGYFYKNYQREIDRFTPPQSP